MACKRVFDIRFSTFCINVENLRSLMYFVADTNKVANKSQKFEWVIQVDYFCWWWSFPKVNHPASNPTLSKKTGQTTFLAAAGFGPNWKFFQQLSPRWRFFRRQIFAKCCQKCSDLIVRKSVLDSVSVLVSDSISGLEASSYFIFWSMASLFFGPI